MANKGFSSKLKGRRSEQQPSASITLNDEDNNSSVPEYLVRAKKDNRLLELPPARFKPDPTQPRKTFSEVELRKLLWDIELNTQLQAILVGEPDEMGVYPILVGERRWRAISLSETPRTVLAIKVDNSLQLDELKILMMQLSENSKRSSISVIEEAYAYQRVVELCKKREQPQKYAAELIGISPSQLTKYLSLISASSDIISLAADGKTQDVETLYNLVQASKSEPEAVQAFVENVQSGEIENSGIRKASKKLLSDKKTKKLDESISLEETATIESSQVKNVLVVDEIELTYPKNSNDVELVVMSKDKTLLLILSEEQLKSLKKKIK